MFDNSLPVDNDTEKNNDSDVRSNDTFNDHDSRVTSHDTQKSGPGLNNKRIILQHFTIYNSTSTMYIVGSNARRNLYRIIEIMSDEDGAGKPVIIEDKSFFYTRHDMVELLAGLNETTEGGIHKVAHAVGLVGLIRFTQGYYLSVVTKSSQVAVLGGHYIYHIDESKLIPLHFNYRRPSKYSDEERLLSIFKYLDLGKTFYFSYTYDVTNSVQTNFMRHKLGDASTSDSNEPCKNSFNERFVWNNFLLEPVLGQRDFCTFDWFQPIIHGFVDQANVSVYGRKIYITLIARRSHHFAGARFLKRGVNDRGDVANEVETEQIVTDMLTSSFHDPKGGAYGNPRVTSFIQHRGSIPLFWTQDLNRLPKPPIEISFLDPFYRSSALHFDDLFQRYGLPLIILNLIKTKEKQPRELKLNLKFQDCISYLGQFLPQDKKLVYHSFDMSKHSKKNMDVIGPLQNIAKEALNSIGFFHNGRTMEETKLQRGVIRTNCIDCLDRTNAAQFIICKEALSLQLQSLGFVTSSKSLDYDSDLINILTEIFHDHGDTIAIQYGGSNLVNTMDSYRRINQWSSHTRDMLNSIKRIYSNSFMDLIRQEAINLFLGNYKYSPEELRIWELQNDYYLHNKIMFDTLQSRLSYQLWYNTLSPSEPIKLSKTFPVEHKTGGPKHDASTESYDNWFNECYGHRNFESFVDQFQCNMNSNVRYFPSKPNNTLKDFEYSPFESRKPFFGKKSFNESVSLANVYNPEENTGLTTSSEKRYIELHDDGSDIKRRSSNGGTHSNTKSRLLLPCFDLDSENPTSLRTAGCFDSSKGARLMKSDADLYRTYLQPLQDNCVNSFAPSVPEQFHTSGQDLHIYASYVDSI